MGRIKSQTKPPGGEHDSLAMRERFGAVIEEFQAKAGQTDQVVKALERRFPSERWSREKIYAELRAGLVSGYVEVRTLRSDLGDRLLERHGLESVDVISSVTFEHVAALAARRLLSIMAEFRASNRTMIRIGFASGYSMSRVARALALLIPSSELAFPKSVKFQALSSSFNVEKIHEDPSFFLARFDEPAIHQKFPGGVQFLGYFAPSLVKGQTQESISEDDEANAHGRSLAKKEAKLLDIVVTGASDIDDPDSTLYEFRKERDQLKEAGCVGHLLYLPLSASGPIPLSQQGFSISTALDLKDLQTLVTEKPGEKRKRVMLVSGPQYRTLDPKRIVATILDQQHTLITDLVIDERTATYALANTRSRASATH
jgi:hypothetical protein